MKRILLAGAALLLTPLAQAADVNITFSDEFKEALAEDYGVREGDYLVKLLTEDLEREFRDAGASISTINVTIEKAKPNRPTMKQMGDKPGLSFESFSIGGAELTGEVIGANGETLANLNYDWFERDIRWAQHAATWSDANRTFGRFATRLSKAVANS